MSTKPADSRDCASIWRSVWSVYAFSDWLIAGTVWVLVGFTQLAPVHHRYISPTLFVYDASINYPYQTSTVPTSVLVVLSLLVPFVLVSLICLFKMWKDPSQSVHAKYEWSAAVSGLLLAVGLATLVTMIVKYSVGRPRPNFIQYCQYNPNSNSCNRDTQDPWMSFPSGHASFSFSGLTFFTLYLLTIFTTFRTSPHASPAEIVERANESSAPRGGSPNKSSSPFVTYEAWVWVVCLLPMFLAGYISCTRITDYYHFTDDVLAGVLLGAFSAYFVAKFKLTPLREVLIEAKRGLLHHEPEDDHSAMEKGLPHANTN